VPKWITLDLPQDIEATSASIAAIRMKDRTLGVDIKVGEASMLRAVFHDCVVTRIMEEAPLEDSETSPDSGIKPNYLAYLLEDSWMLSAHPQAGEDVHHFRLIMPSASVDVLTAIYPKFTMLSIVPTKG
jgi:hypothetical protein